MKTLMTVSVVALGATLSFAALAAAPVPAMPTASRTKPAEAATAAASPEAGVAKPAMHHATMSRHRVEEIQAALNNAGETVAVDGIWGRQTKTALSDYQKKNGLRVTDTFNHQTAEKLPLTNWQG